jgi:hypothetical protein
MTSVTLADGGTDGPGGGADACRKAARGTQCAPPACFDAHTFAAAGVCDGAGHCVAGARIDCGSYLCSGGGCAMPCAAAADCPNGSACIAGSCQVRRVDGQVCAADGDCASGFCSPDRICCDSACAGTCMACAAAATGVADGTCAPVRANLDPRDDCPADPETSCGRTGACDGAGSCALYGAGTQCAAALCDAIGRFVSARSCSAGTCLPAAQDDCGLAICDAMSGCRRVCSGDADCMQGSYCDPHSSTCTSKKTNGAVCSAAHECASTNCVDRVCCDSPCTGLCVSCLAAETGQRADGTCADVVDGTDPENECAVGTDVCGADGFCGQGRCRFAPTNTSCGDSKCVNASDKSSATLTPAARCDGQGACAAATSQPCVGSVLCLSDRECRPGTCSNDADCVAGFYCNAGICTGQRAVGKSCSAADQCTNGFCSDTSQGDAVCCSTSCPLACQACTMASTGVPTGTCAPRLANTTAVCAGNCQVGYGLCSTGLSCQATAWTFDGAPRDSSLPFGWEPDDMSGLHYSEKWNHTPGGSGALEVAAGFTWDATPNVVLCGQDPAKVYPTSIPVGGKTLDAWVLLDGPSTGGTCLFRLISAEGSDELREISFLESTAGVWLEMKDTVPLPDADLVQLGIRCVLSDGWPGKVYIDDVSIQ